MKKSLALMLALIMVLCMLPMTALASYTSPKESKYNLRQNAITFSVTLPNGSTVTDDIGRFRATDSITLGYQWRKDPCGTSYGWVLTINNIPVHAHWADTGNIYRWVKTDEGATGSTANPRQAYILYYANGAPAFVEGKQEQPPTVNGTQITFPPKGPDGGSTATLQINTVITGDQTLTSNGTPFPVTVEAGYAPDNYKTGLDDSNYTYTFVKAVRNSGEGLFKVTASSSNGASSTDNKFRQFFPASGANVVTVYYTAKSKAAHTPTPPDNDDIKELVGSKIQVKCTTANITHPIESYSLLDGSYTTGTVTKDGDAYTCTITVQPGEYVSAYNETYSGHTLVDPSQTRTIKLSWNGTDKKWELATPSGVPVVFDVECENQTPEKPEPPKPENTPAIPGLTDLDEVVKVKCKTVLASHEEKTFGFNWSSCQVGDVTDNGADGYTCTITVLPDGYVTSYNQEYPGHTLDPDGQKETLRLKWNDTAKQWENTESSKLPITFTVMCEVQPPLDKTITIEVSKTWHDDSGAVAKPEKITVNLLKNGTVVENAPIMPDNEGTWFHRFDNMLANDSNDKPINYTVKEEDVPGVWTPYYYTAGLFQGKLIFQIHNVLTENTREIKVTKKVSGKEADETKYFDFKVTLLAYHNGDGETGDGLFPLGGICTFGGVTFTEGVATFKLKHGESFEIKGIPSDLQYKVEEIAPSGYTVKVNGSTGSSISGAFTDAKTVDITFENVKESGTNPTPSPSPTPTPGGGNDGGGHYHPTTPVPVIVIPPKTGDMPFWYSIAQFLGLVK